MCLCFKLILATCPDPTPGNGTSTILVTPPENGTSIPAGRYAVGTVFNIDCNRGYRQTDFESLGYTCQDPGIWAPPIPQCVLNIGSKWSSHHIQLLQHNIQISSS